MQTACLQGYLLTGGDEMGWVTCNIITEDSVSWKWYEHNGLAEQDTGATPHSYTASYFAATAGCILAGCSTGSPQLVQWVTATAGYMTAGYGVSTAGWELQLAMGHHSWVGATSLLSLTCEPATGHTSHT